MKSTYRKLHKYRKLPLFSVKSHHQTTPLQPTFTLFAFKTCPPASQADTGLGIGQGNAIDSSNHDSHHYIPLQKCYFFSNLGTRSVPEFRPWE